MATCHFMGLCSPCWAAFQGAHVTRVVVGKEQLLVLVESPPTGTCTVPQEPLPLNFQNTKYFPFQTHPQPSSFKKRALFCLLVFAWKVLSYNLKENKRTSSPRQTRSSARHQPTKVPAILPSKCLRRNRALSPAGLNSIPQECHRSSEYGWSPPGKESGLQPLILGCCFWLCNLSAEKS